MLTILDVSSYQGSEIVWARVARAGVWGVMVKATQGEHYVNPMLNSQARGARAAGLRVGFYHYCEPDGPHDAQLEADHFSATVRQLMTRRDLRHALDFERWAPRERTRAWNYTLTPEQMVSWARTWNQRVRGATGVGSLIYSYPAFLERLNPATTLGYGLWLAAYSWNDGTEHPYRVPPPWRRAVMHQFSSRARVPGVPRLVDLSHAPSARPILAQPLAGAA